MMQTSATHNSDYTAHFTERSFWRKVKAASCKVGEELLTRAMAMYYALQDPDTPRWARGVILSALGYFILPLDAIPDITPIAGFTDDALVVAGAFATVALHVKELHLMKAKAKLDEWFGRNGDAIKV